MTNGRQIIELTPESPHIPIDVPISVIEGELQEKLTKRKRG